MMSRAGTHEAAMVIDLASSPEMDQRGAARRHGSVARAGVVAVAAAAAANDVIEILSDDDNDSPPPRAMARQRRAKRQRNTAGIPPFNVNGTGQLKDYGEDGRKVRARENQNHDGIRVTGSEDNFVDLLSGSPPPLTAAMTMARRQVDYATLPPELQVLEVYPDADEDAVKALLQQHKQKIEVVVAIMSETGYEKSGVKRASLNPRQGNGITVSMAKTNDWSYDFMAADSFTPGADYVKQAKSQLLCDFPFLTAVGRDIIMNKNSNHYAKAHDFVITILKGTGDEETKFSRLDRVIRGAEPSAEQAQQLNSHQKGKIGVVFKRKSRKNRAIPSVDDQILVEEISYARGKLREYLRNGRKHESVEKKKAAAQKSNTAIDCACCFDGYDIDDMVACTREGHLFCVDCLRTYAENQIFSVGNLGVDRMTKKPALELKCMQGDCTSGFDRRTLEKALTQNTLDKYDSMQCALSLQAADLECMVECPRCQFKVELSSDQKILVCPVKSCKYESCRECGEAAHIPLRCDEVEKKEETKGRITVEEAISQAKIRNCPKCKKAFLKESGCNKITCGCGHKSCEFPLQRKSATTMDNCVESLIRFLCIRRLRLSGQREGLHSLLSTAALPT